MTGFTAYLVPNYPNQKIFILPHREMVQVLRLGS